MLEELIRVPLHLDRELARRALKAIGDPPVELELWDGARLPCAAASPRGLIQLRDRATFWRVLLLGERELGDAYAEGRIEVDGDLADVLTDVFQTWDTPEFGALAWLARLGQLLPDATRAHDLTHSKRNAAHHYDLGHAFYSLWLDEDLSYTCAYYEHPGASIEVAQRAKLDHVARKLRLQPGEHVVEAGGGWGALALHLARTYGVHVRSYNVSHEQVTHARARAEELGLDPVVEFIEGDYREIQGSYDAFVSVGMLEHVGGENFATLGRVIDRCLNAHGRGLIHSIGRMHPAPMDTWMGERIFPGAYIPSLGEMLDVLAPTPFEALDLENLRLHYARTLEQWLERFEDHADRVEALFDARFVRMWRLYLASSIAAFRTGSCQLFQLVFARPGYSKIPRTRADLYRAAAAPSAEP